MTCLPYAVLIFFFFKQKTAYEMRISDWSSDVCSSDLVWSEPAMVDKAAAEFADLGKFMQAAEELYGPYRWGRYDVLVLPPSFPYGGMENPTLTFATPTIIAGDKSLVSVIAHELAHSWSGTLVTNPPWDDFWQLGTASCRERECRYV